MEIEAVNTAHECTCSAFASFDAFGEAGDSDFATEDNVGASRAVAEFDFCGGVCGGRETSGITDERITS